MIKTYTNILNDDLIKKILEYLNSALKKGVWGSNNGWEKSLTLNSSIVLTHQIMDKLLYKKIKNSIETALDIDFEKEELTFISEIYVWSGGSYITWHSDVC